MKKFAIVTDSTCDLPWSFIEEHQVNALCLTYTANGVTKPDDMGAADQNKGFYDFMRSGGVSVTSQVNSESFVELFTSLCKQETDILYIGFSSGLSGTCQSAMIAQKTVQENFPARKIIAVDTLAASLGEGLLVYYAVMMQEDGASLEETAAWLETNKLRMNHWFTVDSLVYLKRGGRVSSAAAFVAGVLDIKPVMHVDDDGHLIPVSKVKGRKKSLRAMYEKMHDKATDLSNQVIAISHGDCLDDVLYLKDIILQEHTVKDVIINPVGPVIGSHSGPGTVALFFLADDRN